MIVRSGGILHRQNPSTLTALHFNHLSPLRLEVDGDGVGVDNKISIFYATKRAERIEGSAEHKSLKVRHKMYVNSCSTELMLFIKINCPGQELAESVLKLMECICPTIIEKAYLENSVMHA